MSGTMRLIGAMAGVCALWGSAGLARGATIEFTLRAAPAQRQVFAGAMTNVWMYTGTQTSGPAGAVQEIPGSYLGPIVRARSGDTVRVLFENRLSEDSIVHWHGLDVPAAQDGHPMDVIGAGQDKVYEFRVGNRAGTYWFHPHPDMRTGAQVMQGLAGLFLVSDAEEDGLGLPRGEYDVPLVIQDRRSDAGNQWVYAFGMEGFLGDRILVNGKPSTTLSVATRVYRLRFLNGSNSRVYKLAWSDGTPMTVIGTEGGLLPAPVTRQYVTLAPGERAEVWADFSGRPVGSQVTLQSQAFTGAGIGGFPTLPNGAAFNVMQVSVDRSEAETLTLPSVLSEVRRYQASEAANASAPKTFAISFAAARFFINGRQFEMTGVAPEETTTTSTLEIWDFTNETGPLRMAHPMHMHGRQFQVVSRSAIAGSEANWNTVRFGYVDEGWKDTFLIMPGERVRVLVRTSRFPGMYVYHCHNLEHEDMGMMRNFMLMDAPCPGDATGNRLVNFGDLNAVLSDFGRVSVPGILDSDVNADGLVNFADLNIVLSAFGTGC